MSDTAFQIQYRQEFIAGFEDGQSVLRSTTTTEAMIKGNQAVFMVADSGGATAKTRGTNGLIAARSDNLNQYTATLAEWHDLARKTNFNIFASQGNQRMIMQGTTMKVLNRKIDDDIIAQLDTATNDTGAAQTASLDLVVYAQTILGNNFVDLTDEDNLFAVISPSFRSYLMKVSEFANGDYIDSKPMTGPVRRYWRWMGVNWIVHPRLSGSIGAGSDSTTEKCYMYHRSAIGHALDSETLDTALGYNDEQAYSFCRVSGIFGSKLLQNSGIVQIKHNGAAYTAQ